MVKRDVVVFDFDGTLTEEDTFITFSIRIFGLRRFLFSMAKVLPALVAWKVGLRSNSYAKESLYSVLYHGQKRSEIKKNAKSFMPKYNVKILEELNYRKSCGATIYIITASLDLWMQEQADKLGVKLCCTETETAPDRLLTGKFATPNCYGEEKLRRLLFLEPDRTAYNLIVYGDSAGDSALLAEADHPIKL